MTEIISPAPEHRGAVVIDVWVTPTGGQFWFPCEPCEKWHYHGNPDGLSVVREAKQIQRAGDVGRVVGDRASHCPARPDGYELRLVGVVPRAAWRNPWSVRHFPASTAA